MSVQTEIISDNRANTISYGIRMNMVTVNSNTNLLNSAEVFRFTAVIQYNNMYWIVSEHGINIATATELEVRTAQTDRSLSNIWTKHWKVNVSNKQENWINVSAMHRLSHSGYPSETKKNSKQLV